MTDKKGEQKTEPNSASLVSDKYKEAVSKAPSPPGTEVQKKKFNGKRVKYLLAGLILLLVAAGSTLYLTRPKNVDQPPQETVTPETIYEGTQLTYTEKAQQMAYTGEYDGAQWLLQEGADNTGDDSAAKSNFYIQKVQLAFDAGRYDDALKYALEADKAQPTALTAVAVAISAENNGDKAMAAKYYQLAADRTPEDQRQSGLSEYEYYLNKAKALEGASGE